MKKFKIDVPWLLAQLGVRKWLKERVIHIPAEFVQAAADQAGVTVEQWRAVEAVQSALIYGAVLTVVQDVVK